MWSKLSLLSAPWLFYIKLAAITLLVAGAALSAWSVRSSYAQTEKAQAVADARLAMQKQVDEERKLRAQFETTSNARLEVLLQSISKLQKDFRVIAGSVAKERRDNPAFYNQPLPDKGYEQWKRARDLLGASNAPAAPP